MSFSERRRLLSKIRQVPVYVLNPTCSGRMSIAKVAGIKVSRHCLCFPPSTHTSWMVSPRLGQQEIMPAPARRFPKYHHARDMSLLERRYLLSKTVTLLSDVPKYPKQVPHKHVGKNGYKSPTSMPLLLSFNPHLLGYYIKNLDPSMLCLRRRGVSNATSKTIMSSSEKSLLSPETLSKYRMFQKPSRASR